MKTRIRRIGNSAGFTLPKECLAAAGFIEGQELHVVASLGSITITGERHIEIVLSLMEAAALLQASPNSAAGIAAQKKISAKIDDPD